MNQAESIMSSQVQRPIVILWIAILGLLLSMGYLAYYPSQSDFQGIAFCGLFAFIAYYVIAFIEKPAIKITFAVGIIIRIILLFSFPNLSDDIYRFVWDGYMTTFGNNPYGSLPVDHLGDLTTSHMSFLIENMNSPKYYTIYPPFTQLIFYISNWAGTDVYLSSIIIKLCFLIAEVFTFLGIRKLLMHLVKSEKLVALYWLNPLILIEGMGNLHFEIIMVSFLVWGIYYAFVKPKLILSALLFALSIASKLLPLMFLPFFLFGLRGKERIRFFLAGFMFLVILFLPIILGLDFVNFGSSIDLYFQKFEFNAGIYYLSRYLGKILTGYNQIQLIGPILGLIAVGLIMYNAHKKETFSLEDFLEFAFYSFCTYLLLATTVHPWYLTIPIFLSVFVRWRFALVWSMLIILTYINYSNDPYHENLWIVGFEYALVFGMIIYEFRKQKVDYSLNAQQKLD